MAKHPNFTNWECIKYVGFGTWAHPDIPIQVQQISAQSYKLVDSDGKDITDEKGGPVRLRSIESAIVEAQRRVAAATAEAPAIKP